MDSEAAFHVTFSLLNALYLLNKKDERILYVLTKPYTDITPVDAISIIIF